MAQKQQNATPVGGGIFVPVLDGKDQRLFAREMADQALACHGDGERVRGDGGPADRPQHNPGERSSRKVSRATLDVAIENQTGARESPYFAGRFYSVKNGCPIVRFGFHRFFSSFRLDYFHHCGDGEYRFGPNRHVRLFRSTVRRRMIRLCRSAYSDRRLGSADRFWLRRHRP
jgi:hypothetical protein